MISYKEYCKLFEAKKAKEKEMVQTADGDMEVVPVEPADKNAKKEVYDKDKDSSARKVGM